MADASMNDTDNLPVMGDPGEVFKAKAQIAFGPLEGLEPIAFTPLELIEVAWIIAQATAMLWKCCNQDPVKAIARAVDPTAFDKVKLFMLVKRSGYSRPVAELVPRLKALAGITPASELAYICNSGQ